MLFNFSFAGEIGYIWLALAQNDIENFHLSSENFYILHDQNNITPVINDRIKINKNNLIIKNRNELENIILKYRELITHQEEFCREFYSYLYSTHKNNFCDMNRYNTNYFILEKNVIAKITNIEKYIEGIFLEIEIIGEFKEDIKEVKSIEPIEEETLCNTKNDSIFSCKTQNNKIISLCKNENNTLGYKFGTKEKIELEYSSKENDDINKYFKNYLYYGMHNYSFELLFSKNKYDYIIYKYTSNNGFDNLSGVIIKKDNKKVSEIKCKYPLENNNQFYNIETFNISVLDSSIL